VIFYRKWLSKGAPASSFDLLDKPVRSGYIRKIERIVIVNDTADRGAVNIYLEGLGYKHYIDKTVDLTQKPVAPEPTIYTIKEDEALGFEFSGLTVGDQVEVYITGYEEEAK